MRSRPLEGVHCFRCSSWFSYPMKKNLWEKCRPSNRILRWTSRIFHRNKLTLYEFSVILFNWFNKNLLEDRFERIDLTVYNYWNTLFVYIDAWCLYAFKNRFIYRYKLCIIKVVCCHYVKHCNILHIPWNETSLQWVTTYR